MNNIDEDIEILKEKLKILNDTKLKKTDQLERELQAIEGKDCVIETQAHNEEVYEELVKKLEKELETYKKIAEKLAEEIYNVASSERCSCSRIIKNIYDYKPQIYNEKDGKKVALDWARKEVEKNES